MCRPDDIVRHPACRSLSARPRQWSPRATLIYDAITQLIKASSRNTDPVQRWVGGGGGWEGLRAAACRPDSIIGTRIISDDGKVSLLPLASVDERERGEGRRDRGRAHSGSRGVHCTCAPWRSEREMMTSWVKTSVCSHQQVNVCFC